MEELTLKEQISHLEAKEIICQTDIQTITDKLHELRKEEKQKNLPKISSDAFDKILSIVEECITNTKIETGSNVDVYYNINDNEIDAEITLTSYFTDEVISDIRNGVYDSDFLAIIEDGN